MKQLTIAPSRHPSIADISVVQWCAGDPFPELGPSVGVDTETELITETDLAPPLVVLGVYDDSSKTCYISYWGDDSRQFMRELCMRNIQQRYFNLGFDEMVLDDQDPERALIGAIDVGRVRDMQIRIHLHAIATLGWIPRDRYNLADCSKRFLGFELDKGDPNDLEHSARLTFHRYGEDGNRYTITEEQAIYLAYDCLTTWMLGETPTVIGSKPPIQLEEQPTEIQHTKGMVVLANIARNGLEVDMRIFDALTSKLLAERDKQRQALLAFGFPDPYKNQESRVEQCRTALQEALSTMCRNHSLADCCRYVVNPETQKQVFVLPSKNKLRLMLLFLYNYSDNAEEVEALVETVADIYSDEKDRTLRKAEQSAYNSLLEDKELLVYDNAAKQIVMLTLVTELLKALNAQYAEGTLLTKGFDFDAALARVSDVFEDNPDMLSSGQAIGPRKFFQRHVHQLLEVNPKLELDTTPKSGDIKLTLKDMWRLNDLGISDPFLAAYTAFYHCQKYLSTYLNPAFIKADHRVHPRFTNILRTGRTSAKSPNSQNLPSRDKAFPLKNMYKPYDGMILCATDFSYLELCAFAQACYTKYGFSVMRDVINAGLDPHRWFAGVRAKIITPDLTHKDDPEWVKETNALLKAEVSDSARQKAKSANFGFPGALGTKRFFQNSREQGVEFTIEEADKLRDEWINTFTEMKEHMKPERVKSPTVYGDPFGFNKGGADVDEDEDDDDDNSKDRYRCVLTCGQVRTNCSYNAACNMAFQGLAAVGAKVAGWNLVLHGYHGRLSNFVHDEYLYCLYPEELKTHIPIIEQLMLDGMRTVIPDVKLGVETTCMLHWDKKATPFEDLKWDGDLPIIEEPPYVKEVLGSHVTA